MRFTDEQVMATLRTVVAERPDYMYDEANEYGQRFYVRNGAPSCLVGHVLHRMGIPLDELSKWEFKEPDQFVHRLGFSGVAAAVLNEAQIAQDQGAAWADALDDAEDAYEGDV